MKIKYKDNILTVDIQRTVKTNKGNYILAYSITPFDDVGISLNVYLSNGLNKPFSRNTWIPKDVLLNRADLVITFFEASDITRIWIVENNATLKETILNTFKKICNVFVVTEIGI